MSTYSDALEVISKYKEAKAKKNIIMTPIHEGKAVKLLGQAAKEGNLEAMYQLAHYYSHLRAFSDRDFNITYAIGMNVDGNSNHYSEDQETSLQWLTKAAEGGHMTSILLLGKYYAESMGGKMRDGQKAIAWYEKAEAAGNVDSFEILINLYKDTKKLDKMFILLKKYAPKNDEEIASWKYSFELALFYDEAGEKENAFRYFSALFQPGIMDLQGIPEQKCGDYYYEKGEYKRAVEHYRKAILKGNVQARDLYKACVKEEKGICKEEALEFYKKGAVAWTKGQLAICYLDGIFEGKNNAEVFQLLKEAYEEDLASRKLFSVFTRDDHLNKQVIMTPDLELATRLGDCYFKGLGTTVDYAKALEYYKMANSISLLYHTIDEIHSQKWKATKDTFLPKCQWDFKCKEQTLHRPVNTTVCLLNLDKHVEAVAGLYILARTEGANQNWARTELGRCLLYGQGIEANTQLGFQYFEKAAKEGGVGGQNMLGFCYLNGIGVDKDEVQGFYWFEKAATSPNAYATPMSNVAYCYQEGCGVKQDYEKAQEWYRKAAEKGDPNAQAHAEALNDKVAEQLKQETIALSIKEISNKLKEKKEEIEGAKIPQTEPKYEGSAHAELDKLIGLSSVKKEVATMEHLLKINQMRKEQGLPVSEVSKHMVFTGNPGTGKTTVARIIAQIYKENGVLSTGQLVETDRGGLVEGYIGQTAPKTTKKVKEALGGVLFIDEAYALTPEDDARDFGQEAVNTLLKLMEDHKDDLVVIVAGYSVQMERFIDSNPGLKSRFTTYIDFPDYTSEEMQQIFDVIATKNQYVVTEGAREALMELWDASHAFANAGNGRAVRNVYEKVQRLQATRIVESGEMSREALVTILAEDVPKEREIFH